MEVVVGYEICAVSTSSGQGEDEAAGWDAEESAAVVASQGRNLALAWKGGRRNFLLSFCEK